MLLYKICFTHQYLQFEPNLNLVWQFWKIHIEIWSLSKKGFWGTPSDYQNITNKIKMSLPPRGTQISLWSKYWRKTLNVSIILYRSTKRDIQLYFRPLFGNLSFTKIHYKIMQYQCISFRKHFNFEYVKRLEHMYYGSKVMHAESRGLRRGTFLLDSTWYHSIAIFEKMHDISEEMLFFHISKEYYPLHGQFFINWITFLM